jgi:rhodanese-related sulfurtransferase
MLNIKGFKLAFMLLFCLLVLLTVQSASSLAITSSESDYFVSSKDLLIRMQKQTDIVLIDVRESSNFEKVSIPGSMNIPLFAVKTKSHLRSNEIVLIANGYDNESLKKECISLKSSGFNSRVLYGGLNSWQEEGGALQGDSFVLKDLNKINPVDIFSEKSIKENLIIDLSQSGARPLLPNSISLSFKDTKTFLISFREALKKHADNKLLSIVILNEKGNDYENIEAAIRTTGVKNVFYLTGGLDAYRKFLEEQSAIRNPVKVKTNDKNQCGTCP